jgi:acyl dehydratase
MTDSLLYLDDLHIGQEFQTGAHTIDVDQIVRFASEFDPQPFHLDADAARSGPFGELVASGWHTAAITMRLVVEGVPVAGGIVGGGGELSWTRPVRPDDTLRVVATIADIKPSRSRPDRGVVTMRCDTRNQHDEPVQVFFARIIVPKRSFAPPAV